MTALNAEQVVALMEFAFNGARVHPDIRLTTAPEIVTHVPRTPSVRD